MHTRTYAIRVVLLAWSSQGCFLFLHLSPTLLWLPTHLPQAERARAAGLARQVEELSQAAQRMQQEAERSAVELAAERLAKQAAQVCRRKGGTDGPRGECLGGRGRQ